MQKQMCVTHKTCQDTNSKNNKNYSLLCLWCLNLTAQKGTWRNQEKALEQVSKGGREAGKFIS